MRHGHRKQHRYERYHGLAEYDLIDGHNGFYRDYRHDLQLCELLAEQRNQHYRHDALDGNGFSEHDLPESVFGGWQHKWFGYNDDHDSVRNCSGERHDDA